MKRLIELTAATGIAAMALALGSFSKVLNSTYDIKPDSPIAGMKCGVCHQKATGGKLNPYGTAMAEAMKAANTTKLTPDVLKTIDGKDSDGDGMKNGAEIKAGRNPGKSG